MKLFSADSSPEYGNIETGRQLAGQVGLCCGRTVLGRGVLAPARLCPHLTWLAGGEEAAPDPPGSADLLMFSSTPPAVETAARPVSAHYPSPTAACTRPRCPASGAAASPSWALQGGAGRGGVVLPSLVHWTAAAMRGWGRTMRVWGRWRHPAVVPAWACPAVLLTGTTGGTEVIQGSQARQCCHSNGLPGDLVSRKVATDTDNPTWVPIHGCNQADIYRLHRQAVKCKIFF